jgi:hypothetical protein
MFDKPHLANSAATKKLPGCLGNLRVLFLPWIIDNRPLVL